MTYFRYFEKEENDKKKPIEIEETVGIKKYIKVNDMKKVKIRFNDLAISKYTLKGLLKAKYVKLTEVQRCSIPHSLSNRNMMVCSRTGSGKTLSYLIPLVEKLYRNKWGSLDGLGGLVIVPVRELAIQTFEVLRSFANLHDMSAGMIIGGKNVDVEKSRIASMNILVATPGRLLQHMNETPYFDWDNLQMLVLDEVDRILDMGFYDELNQILSNLPMKKVQTLLFSATAKKSLQKYARTVIGKNFNYFTLNNYDDSISQAIEGAPEGEEAKTGEDALVAKYITPIKLTHFYMQIEANQKLDTLFSFIKSHKDAK
jgi:ATP-dependent RNA helicase DDX10/DBP4